jgi:hypothetical protein
MWSPMRTHATVSSSACSIDCVRCEIGVGRETCRSHMLTDVHWYIQDPNIDRYTARRVSSSI